MTDVEKIEYYSMEHCQSCELALHDITPVLQKHNIPLEIKNDIISGVVYPLICIVRKNNGGRECIQGYGKDIADDLENML